MRHKLFLTLAVSFLCTACATSPTGRNQLLMMPDAEINQMGLQAFSELKNTKPISKNNSYKKFATCIARPLTQQVGGNWEVVVFEDETLNAFALPGNKIGVHSGLIKLVDNQDQLAAVIGHEIGHVLAKHSNERMSQETAVSGGLSVLSAVIPVAGASAALTQVGMSALGVAAQYGVILPFSRTHESEADVMGMEMMAKAGFDPKQSVVLWQKMSKASAGQQTPEFMSTHPADSTRIADLTEKLPTALAQYQKAQAAGKHPTCKK